jgi:hypothetical protein
VREKIGAELQGYDTGRTRRRLAYHPECQARCLGYPQRDDESYFFKHFKTPKIHENYYKAYITYNTLFAVKSQYIIFLKKGIYIEISEKCCLDFADKNLSRILSKVSVGFYRQIKGVFFAVLAVIFLVACFKNSLLYLRRKVSLCSFSLMD